MYKVNTSLKLITKCTILGEDISEFTEKINSCGYYTYIDGYDESEEVTCGDEVDVLVFKIIQ